MARESDFIVQATVQPSSRRVELRDGVPWTCITLSVSKTIKGSQGPHPQLCFLGGKAGDTTLTVSGVFILPEGREGIFFCHDSSRRYVTSLVGWSQGVFYISREVQAGEEVVTAANGVPVVDIQVNATASPRGAPTQAAGVILAQPGHPVISPVTPARLISSIHQALVESR